ncbi:MAG: tetratricopeptide repeat protein [Deltaproteobacteria bacterium]|nr:tetratricopeptide repeat protein [Deltaproteobacteria bacterium]
MSLIHQALKKIEAARSAYNPPAEFTPPSAGSRRPKAAVIVAVLLVVLIPAGYAAYSLLSSVEKVERAANDDPGLDALKASISAPRRPKTDVDPSAHNAKGIELFRSMQYGDAEKEFKAALALRPVEAAYYNNLALALALSGREEEALTLLKEALDLNPRHIEALNNLGALLERKGDAASAVKRLKEALKIDPGYADALLNLGVALERQGRTREALEAYERFLEKDRTGPQGEEAAKKVMRLKSGLIIKAREG